MQTSLDIKTLRKDLKAMGYKLTIKSFSFGQHATVTHIKTGFTNKTIGDREMGHIEAMADWLQYSDTNKSAIKSLGVIGLI